MLAIALPPSMNNANSSRTQRQPIASSSKLPPPSPNVPSSSYWNVPDSKTLLESFSWPSLWFDVPSVSPQARDGARSSHWSEPSFSSAMNDDLSDFLDNIPDLVPSESDAWSGSPESSPASCFTPAPLTLLSRAPSNIIVSVAPDVPLHAPRPRPLRPPPVLQYDFDKEAEQDSTQDEHANAITQNRVVEDGRHSYEYPSFSNFYSFGQTGFPWSQPDTLGGICNPRTHNHLKRSSSDLGLDRANPNLDPQPLTTGAISKRRKIDTGESAPQTPSLLDDLAFTIQTRASDQVRPHALNQAQAQAAPQPCIPPQSNPNAVAYISEYAPMLSNEHFALSHAYQDTIASTLEWLSHSSGLP